MIRTVTGLAVAAVLLTGCSGSGDGGNDGGNGGGDAEASGENASGPLAGLDGDELCALVDRGTIEEQFNDPVREVLGGPGRPDQPEAVVCDYVTESLMESDIEDVDGALSVGTRVRLAKDGAKTAEDALDAYMINLEDETVDYQPVDGLGDAAGYADSSLDVLTDGNHLAAIIEVDGVFIEVVTKSEPAGTLDQLRPLADELVAGVESELG